MSRVRRDIEAMADLLLGPAGVSMPDQVSVLIDGNLPSRGDGWRSAAARLLAQRAPASFLQARFGSLDALHLGESQPQGTALAQLFESAPQGHHWIVSMGSALDPSTLQGVDEVVLLTGVDEAAIVAAYALLKQIVCDCPGPMPVVRLVLAGADSLEAGDRFVRTARARLGVEPIVAGCLPEPDRVHHAWQRLDLPDGGIGAVLTTLVAAAGSRTGAAHVSAHVPPPPVQASAPAPPQEALGSEARPPEQLPPSNSVNPPVQPSPSAAPRPPLPEGFEPLAITCPCAPSVVFATDQSGSLHAVTSAATLADLVAAIGWAQQHAAMLPGDSPVKGHVLVGDIHSASVLGAGPWPVHLVIDGPQGPQVLPAQTQPLSQGPSGTTVPGWPSTT